MRFQEWDISGPSNLSRLITIIGLNPLRFLPVVILCWIRSVLRTVLDGYLISLESVCLRALWRISKFIRATLLLIALLNDFDDL